MDYSGRVESQEFSSFYYYVQNAAWPVNDLGNFPPCRILSHIFSFHRHFHDNFFLGVLIHLDVAANLAIHLHANCRMSRKIVTTATLKLWCPMNSSEHVTALCLSSQIVASRCFSCWPPPRPKRKHCIPTSPEHRLTSNHRCAVSKSMCRF